MSSKATVKQKKQVSIKFTKSCIKLYIAHHDCTYSMPATPLHVIHRVSRVSNNKQDHNDFSNQFQVKVCVMKYNCARLSLYNNDAFNTNPNNAIVGPSDVEIFFRQVRAR